MSETEILCGAMTTYSNYRDASKDWDATVPVETKQGLGTLTLDEQ